jgi:hypothetical protein
MVPRPLLREGCHLMPWSNDPESRARSNRVYGPAWRRARGAQLAAHPECQIGLPGCTIVATEADHIDQAAGDPDHQRLRSACHECHLQVTARQGGRGHSADPPHVPRPGAWWT